MDAKKMTFAELFAEITARLAVGASYPIGPRDPVQSAMRAAHIVVLELLAMLDKQLNAADDPVLVAFIGLVQSAALMELATKRHQVMLEMSDAESALAYTAAREMLQTMAKCTNKVTWN